MRLAVRAVGTRKLTVRSVVCSTERTRMIVVPTTTANNRQSTLKPAINHPRMFRLNDGIETPPRQNPHE
jgi:hypothetical protein